MPSRTTWQILICRKKIRYPSHRAAKLEAKDLRERLGRRLRPYRCKVCGGYHLTSERDWNGTETRALDA